MDLAVWLMTLQTRWTSGSAVEVGYFLSVKKEKERKRKGKKNNASSKKLLTSFKEKGPLGNESPLTRKEKGVQ